MSAAVLRAPFPWFGSKSRAALTMELRPYQTRTIDSVFAGFAAGRRRVLIVAPTGAGKTVMFAALAERFHAEGKRVLVVAHREELIEQAAAKLRGAGIARVGIYRGKANSRDLDGATCVVASIQARGLAQFGADLVIVDEAHHTPAESYTKLLDLFPEALHVGATATPWWGKGKGLGGYFESFVVATTVRELTDLGHLARVRMFTHPHTLRDLDLRGVATLGDDYKVSAIAERVDRPSLIGDIVAHWQSHANGARTLCFAASVEHSRHIVDRFRTEGIVAEHLDGQTPLPERRAILARLRSGETPVVCNYGVLVEGFDEPSVGCVILARPTRRAQVYLQAVGRGMRVVADKPSVVVLDHAGCCLAYGFPDDERPVSLTETTGDGAGGFVPTRRCPECGLMVHPAVRECPECATALRSTVATEEASGLLVEAVRATCVADERKLYHYKGVSLTAHQWAERLGISYWAFYGRVRRGLPDDDIFAGQSPKSSKITFHGKSQSRKAWAAELGASHELVRRRLAEGWPLERALTEPPPERTVVVIDGRERLLSDVAKEIGLGVRLLRARLRAGKTGAELLAPVVPKSEAAMRAHQSRSKLWGVVHNGERYTLKQFARRCGVSRNTIRRMLDRGLSTAQIAEACAARAV